MRVISLVVLSLGWVCLGADATLPLNLAERSERFQKGTRMGGVGAGAGFGTTRFGGLVNHDWVVLQAHCAVVVSDVLAEERFFEGRLAFGGEILLARQYRPRSAGLLGATPLIRYLFETDGRWVPFLEGGVGFAVTDIGRPSLGGNFQFSPQAGVGFFWMLKPDLALAAQHRMIHYSNAGTRSPNVGINQHVFLVGVSRFY